MGTLLILGNNKCNIRMMKNDKFYNYLKYINIQHYFIRELVKKNEISINYINTKKILVDNFRKVLGKLEFLNHRRRIKMVIVDDENNQEEI